MKFNTATMDVDTPVLEGHLNVPNQSGFSLNRISKKKTCHRYCLLFKSSRYGIERLEICETKDDKSPKIITLENCVKITQEPTPSTSIQIVKKTGTLTLTALTEEDQKAWVHALQTVAFRDKATTHVPQQAAIEEDNDLYCSSYADGFFLVKLIPTETSVRCNIEPTTYMLHLSATELQLKSQEDMNIIKAKWPYRFIRKYGYRDGKFTFEAGRKCLTGEGMFTLYHVNPQEVFRCMSAKMKSMKKLISGDSMNSIDCGENQLCAVAHMEAGSRSPVPPSPSKQHADFEMNSAASLRGLLSSSDSLNNFSINSNSTTSNNNSITSLIAAKQIPHKPPRKLPVPLEKLNLVAPNLKPMATPPNTLDLKPVSQLNCDQYRKFQNYEPVQITTGVDGNKHVNSSVLIKSAASPENNNNKRLNIPPSLPLRNDNNNTTSTLPSGGERDYECIQNITDAWKTLGVGNVNHNERTLRAINNEEELIEFMLQQRAKSKVTDLDHSDVDSASTEGNYDRLDFLTPNNKTSSGYKTIVTVSATRGRCSPPSSNDYELIASPDIQPYRKADDSYLGYGVVRKSSANEQQQNVTPTTPVTATSTTSTTTTTKLGETVLEHRNYNDLNYTVVSKPKTV